MPTGSLKDEKAVLEQQLAHNAAALATLESQLEAADSTLVDRDSALEKLAAQVRCSC